VILNNFFYINIWPIFFRFATLARQSFAEKKNKKQKEQNFPETRFDFKSTRFLQRLVASASRVDARRTTKTKTQSLPTN
jgi:ribosomal protein S18